MTISTLDFSTFARGTKNERLDTAKALLARLTQHGHVELTGHGIADEVIDQTFEMVSGAVHEPNQPSSVR